jgi:segregation and condensation protein A
MECKVKLEVFEGPLDLLLHLIKKNKIDIHNIPISLITEQYLEYLSLMRSLNLDLASDYLVMAATLVHIKSMMLLPRQAPSDQEGSDEEEGGDPREELVRRLIEYEKYKRAAQALSQAHILGKDVFSRPPIGDEERAEEEDLPLEEASVFDLADAFCRLLKRRQMEETFLEVDMERVSLADRIRELSELLSGLKGGLLLEELFPLGASRRELVVTFLALLEMVRLKMVRVLQAVPFGPIKVMSV